MISHNKQFIFIAIPKTGTTSILKGPFRELRECSEEDFFVKKHNHLSSYSTFVDSYFKFAFVRDPWDWVLSWFLYRKKIKNQYNTSGMDFASWVMDPATFKSSQSGVGPHVDQHKYLLHKDEIKVDFLGRFENLQNDFSKLCLNLNISYPPLPHLNKSSHRQYSSYYNKECREAVHDRFIKDIEYFDYKFQEK